MHVIVHFEDLLLLSIQSISSLSISLVHDGEAHRAWHENVIGFWRVDLRLNVVVVLVSFNLAEVGAWLVAVVVSHISSVAGVYVIFLIVTVEFLDV